MRKYVKYISGACTVKLKYECTCNKRLQLRGWYLAWKQYNQIKFLSEGSARLILLVFVSI